MKDDQRIALTKRLLREGLLRLLSKTDLNKISVTQLCIESGINRATFYRHYEEPRDILNDIKYEIFQEVAAFAEKAASKGDTRKWLELACCYFYEHSDILKILFRYRTDDDFVLFLNERFNEQYPNLINKGYFTDVDDDTMRLGTFYYAGGIYYILRQWITEPLNAAMLEEVLQKMGDEGRTMLISTHDVDFAYRWAERVIVFCHGKIIADDTPLAVFKQEDILKQANLKHPMMFDVYDILKEKGIVPDGDVYPKNIAEFQAMVKGL